MAEPSKRVMQAAWDAFELPTENDRLGAFSGHVEQVEKATAAIQAEVVAEIVEYVQASDNFRFDDGEEIADAIATRFGQESS